MNRSSLVGWLVTSARKRTNEQDGREETGHRHDTTEHDKPGTGKTGYGRTRPGLAGQIGCRLGRLDPQRKQNGRAMGGFKHKPPLQPPQGHFAQYLPTAGTTLQHQKAYRRGSLG